MGVGDIDSVPRPVNASRDAIVLNRTFVGARDQGFGTSQTFNTIGLSPGTQYTAKNLIFQLNDLPGFTDFTTLFSEYRVLELEFTFVPVFNSYNSTVSPVGTGMGQAMAPILMTAVDEDGAANNSRVEQQLQYSTNIIHHHPQGTTKVRFRPSWFTSAQTGVTGTTSNSAKGQGWIALLSGSGGGSVDHFGCAVGVYTPEVVDPGAPGPLTCYQVFTTAKLAFRHPF